MFFFRVWFKKIVMRALFLTVAIYARLARRQPERVKKVGILFLPILGIGDLVMLSPVIQALIDLYPNAAVTLITWVPEIIQFKNIRIITRDMARAERFDLIISPALSLRHLPFIFKSRLWCGYFATNRVQSNFGAPQTEYDFDRGHYLLRGIAVLAALDPDSALAWEERFKTKKIPYPTLITKEPGYFSEALSGARYAVFTIHAQFVDRSWPVENFVAVGEYLISSGLVDKIVLVGGKSTDDQNIAGQFIAAARMVKEKIINTTGKNTLAETSFLMARCRLFVGLDVGPAHLAYLAAPRSIPIFVTVDPARRVPRDSEAAKKIFPVYLTTPPPQPLYNELAPVPPSVAARYRRQISIEQVIETINLACTTPINLNR